MKVRLSVCKSIVAALWIAVGYSLPAQADADRLADLMEQLRTAENARAADLILREITAEWSRSGSPTVDLLLQRGTAALESGDYHAAVEHLTAAIDVAPDFAEAWHQRATALYLSGDIGPALDDLRQTLVLNPGHFGAMQGIAVMMQEMGDKESALQAFRLILDINPQDPDVPRAIEQLERDLAGRAL
jgi:tetratricopeptide (TPR) repeat protein